MIKTKYVFLFVVVFLLAGGGLFAQNAQNLNFGSLVSGRLSSGSEVWYRVTPAQSGFISVETKGDTDTYIEFYDSARNLLTEDDDSGEAYNAYVDYYVTAGTAYLIKVRSYDSSISGAFQILASYLPAPNPVELRIGGASTSATLAAGGSDWYSVRTASSGIIIVETTGNLDTYLEAYDSSYKFLGADDDSGNGYNAKLDVFVEANQTYFFRVKDYDKEESGRYQISAKNASVTELRIGGNQVSGNLTAGGSIWYSVRTTARGMLVVETTGSTDTYLEVFSASNGYLGADDDSGKDLNARLEILSEAGQTYFFRLMAYEEESGRFQISAKSSPIPVPVELGVGRELPGTLAAGGSNWYSVSTASRGTLIVETTGDTDTFLEAYTESYELLTFDDDSGSGLNARIELPVGANETYIFRLKAYDSTIPISGNYQIFARLR
jgi:hypothetical protein